jgi:hypothetical protein
MNEWISNDGSSTSVQQKKLLKIIRHLHGTAMTNAAGIADGAND